MDIFYERKIELGKKYDKLVKLKGFLSGALP